MELAGRELNIVDPRHLGVCVARLDGLRRNLSSIVRSEHDVGLYTCNRASYRRIHAYLQSSRYITRATDRGKISHHKRNIPWPLRREEEGGCCLHHLFDGDLRLQDELFGICGGMPARVYLDGVSNYSRVVVDMATQFDLHQIPSFQGLLRENPGKGEPASTTLPQQVT